MPRYYNNIIKPPANKAAAPMTETKSGKAVPPVPPENSSKDQNKKNETGGQ